MKHVHRPSLWKGLILALGLLSLLLLGTYWRTAVHAAGSVLIQPHTCFDTPNDQNCNGQNPIQTNCSEDAQTVRSQPVERNDVQIGYVDLRASKQCHSYWVRAIGFTNSSILTVEAVTQIAADANFAPGATSSFTNSTQSADGSVQAYTEMSYRQSPPSADAEGIFYFIDGTSLTVHV